MPLNKSDFLMTVNFVLFKIEDREPQNNKHLPEKKLMVLLEKRQRPPYDGCWLFPYGFVSIDESLDQAVYRELKEKTNVDDLYFEQLYTWGALDRDPSARVIATSYIALLPQNQKPAKTIKETSTMRWFEVDKKSLTKTTLTNHQMLNTYRLELFNQEIDNKITYEIQEHTFIQSFDKRTKYTYTPLTEGNQRLAYDHFKILDYALDRIKNKVYYTNIAFGLLPPLFTLTELQQVYELLLGKKLIKSNFRQLISRKVEKTNQTKRIGAYRPATLYQLKQSAILDD